MTTDQAADQAVDQAADQTPSVSVVIATRNRPELLRQAIAAVADQDYPGQVECVIVFDQAPIDPAIASDHASDHAAGRARVRTISNDRTPGLAGARNTGIKAATGTLIAFCDDDDSWLPGKLRLQVEALEESGADVAVSGIEVHYADRVVPRVPRASDLTVTELARRRVMEAHPSTVLVRRTALVGTDAAIGLIDEEIPGSYGEDFDWILRAAAAGPIAVVELPLVQVRWGAQSYFQQRWQTIIEAIDYGLAKHAVLSADARGHARLLGRKAFAYAALGRRRDALRWALRSWRLNKREQRSYIAALIGLRLVSADRALRLAHSRGRGI